MSMRKLSALVLRVSRQLGLGRADSGSAAKAAADGDAARDRRAWREAAGHYRRALEAKPGWTAIRVQLANMLKESGEPDQAEAQYRIALQAEPDNADTYLQLGHALKLQARHDEACQAYLSAACRDPDLEPARNELRNAGLSEAVVDRHIASARKLSSEEGTEEPYAGRDRRPINGQLPGVPRGLIREVGRDFIAGELIDVGHSMLPLTLVCRDHKGECAVVVIADDGAGPAAFPRTMPFQIKFMGRQPEGILQVLIEPVGSELSGSPLLLPDPNGSALLERIARIEDTLARGYPPVDLVAQLERRLAPGLTQIAADRLERVIRHQRESFERQLIAIETRLTGQARAEPAAGSTPAPGAFAFPIQNAMPGLGWGMVELGSGGRSIRRIESQAWLTARIAPGCGALLRVKFPAECSRAQLAQLAIASGGNQVRHWISFSSEAVNEPEQNWELSALIPSEVIDFEGRVTCSIRYGAGQSNGPDRFGIPVTGIGIEALTSVSEAELSAGQGCWWLVQPGDAQTETTAILPGLATKLEFDLEVRFASDGARTDMAINGEALAVVATPDGLLSAVLPRAALLIGRPNILTFRGNVQLQCLGVAARGTQQPDDRPA